MTLRLSGKIYWHGKNSETIKMRKLIGNLQVRMHGLNYLGFIRQSRIDLTLTLVFFFIFYIGTCYLCENNFNEAIETYTKVIIINPQYAEAWYNKGVALDDLGRFEKELIAYDKAIEINPSLKR